MTVPITYMGTKRQLAQHVKALADESRPGAFLDAFSGMCTIGSVVATSRPVWSNDAQRFAAVVAEALFTAVSPPPNPLKILTFLRTFLQSLIDCGGAESRNVELEQYAFKYKDIELFNQLFDQGLNRATRGVFGAQRLGVFSLLYAGSYFGYRQSIEIDS